MKKVGDILTDAHLKERAFNVPEGYFESLECRVSEEIGAQAAGSRFWTVFKPAALLACMFVLIFGIGYATLSLTDTLKTDGPALAEENTDAGGDSFDEDEIIEYLAQALTLEDISTYASEESANSNN